MVVEQEDRLKMSRWYSIDYLVLKLNSHVWIFWIDYDKIVEFCKDRYKMVQISRVRIEDGKKVPFTNHYQIVLNK